MITGKYGKQIAELSKNRSEITTELVCEAEKLYLIQKKTLVDGKIPKRKPSRGLDASWCEEQIKRYGPLWGAQAVETQPWSGGLFGGSLSGLFGGI
jgi:hypothetical protein